MLGNRNQTKHIHDARAVDNNYRVPENSRGRYLIIVAEDTDLGGHYFNQVNTMAPMNNWGQEDTGGADTNEIAKRFSNSSFLGGFYDFSHQGNEEDTNQWPYMTKNNEDFGQQNVGSGYYGFHNNYEEALLGTNFMSYLKSRGFVVDVAIMDRRTHGTSGAYSMAHPDDVLDYADLIPFVTEDWSRLRLDYGDQIDWNFGPDFWKAECLWAHIQWFKNKYRDTDHPLKYVLLLGEPCSMATGAETAVRGTQCIPGFSTPSYSFTMDDISDWPYHWDSELVYQRYNGEYDYLRLQTYDDVIQACSVGSANLIGDIDRNSWSPYNNTYNDYIAPDDDLNTFLRTKTIKEPDISVSRIITKERGDANRAKHFSNALNHTVGYHNFQHLYLVNSPFCHSEEGGNPAYGVCKKPDRFNPSSFDELPHDWGLFQDDSFPDYNCRIQGEDAIMAGCESGYCMWFSEDCSDWSEMEYFKEYLGNSIHIGVNYAG